MIQILLLISLFFNTYNIFASDCRPSQDCPSCYDYLEDLPCKSPTKARQSEQCSLINVLSLCAKKLGACCIVTDTLTAEAICTENLLAQKACVDDLRINNFCAQTGNFQTVCANTVSTNTACSLYTHANRACILEERAGFLCADDIATQDLCVSGTISGRHVNCSFYSARVAVSTDYTYTLGETIDFDQINYDPAGTIVQNPTRFIAPLTGVYMVTAQVVVNDLQGSTIIAGNPVASAEIFVNNTLRRRQFVPFLSFATDQSSMATSLIFLNQGDELEVRYEVFVIDPNTGFTSYNGTISINGNIGIDFRTFMSIHYVYSDCTDFDCAPCDIPCIPCQPCTVQPCAPCDITPCAPCFPLCEPCCGNRC